MRRGDIYLLGLEPACGSEANTSRPAVVVSNNAATRSVERANRGVVTVVPVTSHTSRVLPFQVLLPAADCGLRSASKAQAEQVRSVTAERFSHRIGAVPEKLMTDLDEALRRHLAL